MTQGGLGVKRLLKGVGKREIKSLSISLYERETKHLIKALTLLKK
jgi:hypothetical protein